MPKPICKLLKMDRILNLEFKILYLWWDLQKIFLASKVIGNQSAHKPRWKEAILFTVAAQPT